MNAKTTRILKEARALFWPWCAVTLVGALPLLQSRFIAGGTNWIEVAGFLGFFIGIPLLATLSFGDEFQHRTLSLLLTLPADRMEIWGEKLTVTSIAVLSAALVYHTGWQAQLQQLPGLELFFGSCILATVASAPFWTLAARSTLGAITLNYVAPYLVFIVWGRGAHWRFQSTPAIVPFVLLGYAGVMLWLGRRKLTRFQLAESVAGDGLLAAGAEVRPGGWAGWLRCRPSGAVLNLVRKELRLLRPLWLLTLLSVVGWMSVTLLGVTPEGGPKQPVQFFTVVLLGSLSLLIAILVGSLSLGEERTSGTHSWHLTLPVSARSQWLIKLFVVLLTGPVCAVLLPVLAVSAGRFLLGSHPMFVDRQIVVVWLLTAALLSLAAFWCACAVNGTVRAVLWLFPAMAVLQLAGRFGDRVARGLMDLIASGSVLFGDFGFTNAVSNLQVYGRDLTPALVLTLLWVPALLFAVPQSYRLFRKQLQDSARFVVRPLLPLALAAFLCTFSLAAFDAFVDNAKQQMWTMFRETHEAIEKVQPDTAKLEATHPLQLTVEELAKASPLSERTRRWLGGSVITVVPDTPHPGRPYCCGVNSRGITLVPEKARSWYLATIQLRNGSSCTVSFMAARGYGTLGGVCK